MLLTNCHLGGLDVKHPCIVLSALQREVELLTVLYPLHRALRAAPRIAVLGVVVLAAAWANSGYVAHIQNNNAFVGGALASVFAVLTAHVPYVAFTSPLVYVLRNHFPLRGGAVEPFVIGSVV